VDNLTSNNTIPKTAVTYYYCDYADDNTLHFSTFLGTITKQILEKLTDVPLDIEEQIKSSIKCPNNDNMTQILLSALSTFSRVYIIIDGIDELPTADQRAICSISERFQRFKNPEIKLFISSRPNTTITTSLSGFCVNLSTVNISPDIGYFVRARVKSSLDSGNLKIQDPALEEEIVRTLLEGAKGLYACQIPHWYDI
jgi:hypothetical protein